jgi:hypothetical protein
VYRPNPTDKPYTYRDLLKLFMRSTKRAAQAERTFIDATASSERKHAATLAGKASGKTRAAKNALRDESIRKALDADTTPKAITGDRKIFPKQARVSKNEQQRRLHVVYRVKNRPRP